MRYWITESHDGLLAYTNLMMAIETGEDAQGAAAALNTVMKQETEGMTEAARQAAALACFGKLYNTMLDGGKVKTDIEAFAQVADMAFSGMELPDAGVFLAIREKITAFRKNFSDAAPLVELCEDSTAYPEVFDYLLHRELLNLIMRSPCWNGCLETVRHLTAKVSAAAQEVVAAAEGLSGPDLLYDDLSEG